MKDESKTKKQLVSELVELRQRVTALQKSKDELKKVQEAHRESESRYRELVETINEGLALADENYMLIYVNERFCEMLGYTKEELLGHHLIEFVHDGDRHMMQEQMARRRRGEARRFELAWRGKDGHKIYTIASPRAFFDSEGRFKGSLGVLTDITARKEAEKKLRKAHDELEMRVERRTAELLMANEQLKQEIEEHKSTEEALREKEKTLQAILAASPVGIGLVRNRILDWANQSMYRIWGYQEDSLLGKNAEMLYPDVEEYERVGREFYSGIEENEIGQIETQWVTKEGNFIHCYLQGSPLHPSDLSKGVIVAAMDVTDLKQAEEALRESEERFRQAFENANIGMCLVDTEGRFVKVNNQMAEIFGYSQDELEGMTVNDITHQDYLDVSPRFIQRASSGEITHAEFEKQYYHKKGHIVWGQVTSSLVRDDSGEPLYFISHVKDISERKIAEERLHTYQEQLLSLASELLLTEERQRRRLATDLHDSIGQALAIA